MQRGKRYRHGQMTEKSSRNFGSSILYALLLAMVLWVLLLLAISLAEWLMPNLFRAFGLYIVSVIPIISIGVGTYLAARRIGRMAVWIGGINGIVCWSIGMGIAWYCDVTITVSWMTISAGVCLAVSFIGALLGVLCTK